MNVLVLQHVPFEWIGSMEPWLMARGATITTMRLWESTALPDVQGLDLVIAMGGPMSINDEAEHPWLVPEKAFLREVVAVGVPAVGVCLGAQLIAGALGAEVAPNPQKEIGWFPIRVVEAEGDVFPFPAEANVFHWHGETFDLPPGAARLAESDACANQAFQLGRNVIGIQFHLETTPETAGLLIDNCRDELVPGAFIQSEAGMRAVPDSAYAEINTLMGKVLAWVLR